MKISDNIIGLQHIGIPTKQMQETLDFYQALEFTLEYETMNGSSRVAFLKMKNIMLEIYEEEKVNREAGAINHFAIDVADIEQAFAEIQNMELKILEPITFLPFWKNGVKFFIIEGVNGERVEFAQYL